jgi:N-acetylglucosaminyldiphosphoundecaprenol N-acetyl-beta-D-mannosaminyltransferase
MSQRFELFGQSYFCGSLDEAADWVLAGGARPRFVCVANVHTAMNALWDRQLKRVFHAADLKVPDGRPLSLLARLKGRPAHQIRGADLMRTVARRGLKKSARHYFYGGAPGVAQDCAKALAREAPGLKVAGFESPPFRPLSSAESKTLKAKLKRLKVDVLWVGLGAPKQELWMHASNGSLALTQLGVGAAFDYFAGTRAEAPAWMRQLGLEWAYRLLQEPRRLWRRYLVSNLAFLALAPFELLGLWPQREQA